MNKQKFKIAIDGFSACGKSTLAKQLAKKLGFIYIDSGAMYRAVCLFVLRNDLLKNDQLDLPLALDLISKIKISFKLDSDNNPITFLNGENVEGEIRKIEISNKVSIISAIPEIRKQMVSLQQDLSKEKSVIMDGRDIGTVVFKDADLKLYLDADVEVRTQRRYDELIKKGMPATYEEVKKNLLYRDNLDQTREDSPLKKADDAILLDNTHLNEEEQLEIALILAQKVINESRNR